MTEQQHPNQPPAGYGTPPPPAGPPPQHWPQGTYPPHGYGPPWQVAPEPRNAFGLTALILGAIGLLFGIVPVTGFIAFGLGAVGLIFGLSNIGRLRRRRATNKVMTGFGLATSLGAVVLGIVGMAIFFSAMNQLGNDLDEFSTEMDCIAEAESVEEMNACEQP